MKKCKRCLTTKLLSEFAKRSVNADGYNAKCKDCANELHRLWNAEHPDRVKFHNRNRTRRPDYDRERWQMRRYTNHGLTPESYDGILHRQGGVCAICRSLPKKSFHVDHDHGCCNGDFGCEKCVRGLLCERCNRAIGQLEDSPALLRAAAQYLETANR